MTKAKKLPKYLTPAALGFRNVKVKTTPEFYNWLLHLNPAQQGLVKEVLFQLGGRKPSRLYAQYRFADPLPSEKGRERARKMAHLEHNHIKIGESLNYHYMVLMVTKHLIVYGLHKFGKKIH